MYNYYDLIKVIDFDFKELGDRSVCKFNDVSSLNDGKENTLSWLKKGLQNKIEILKNSKCNVIVTDYALEEELKEFLSDKFFILVDDPKLRFIKIATKLFKQETKVGIDKSSTLHPEAKLGENVYIGPNCYIGKVIIGDNVQIMGNNVILDKTIIGNNVVINPGTVIGSEGFGYSRDEDKSLKKFPHFGGVIIEDDVEIGSNTCVDRGTLGNTIIKRGTKIDNLVHVAHNVEIGEYCLIIANSMLGGSLKIGPYSWVAPSASLMNGISIGSDVTVGMGAVVVKSVEDGQTVAGVPARPLNEFIKIQSKLKNL
ncbi:MAG: DapH/DapD/GlmU-related protein [Candidatus Woesearchaeota archaeon]